MVEDKRIPITDKRTGETRLSDPIRQSARKRSESPSETVRSVPEISNLAPEVLVNPGESQSREESTESVDDVERHASQEAVGDRSKPQAKAKVDIETLGQFIAHAYGQKGRKFALKDKTVFLDVLIDDMEHVYPMHIAPNGSMKDMWLSKNERT